jgi:hypothetical protein
MMAFYGVIAGAARTAAIRRIQSKLREKGAVSRKNAVMPEEAGMTSRVELTGLENLVREGKVGKTKDGRVWLKG